MVELVDDTNNMPFTSLISVHIAQIAKLQTYVITGGNEAVFEPANAVIGNSSLRFRGKPNSNCAISISRGK